MENHLVQLYRKRRLKRLELCGPRNHPAWRRTWPSGRARSHAPAARLPHPAQRLAAATCPQALHAESAPTARPPPVTQTARPMGAGGAGRGGARPEAAGGGACGVKAPLCPWREGEASELRPETSGPGDGQDVGFVSPGHRPGCEQEEAAGHPGRPHPDTFSSKQDKTTS